MSCTSAAHRSRPAAAASRPSSVARRSPNSLTRSLCPRVRRSCWPRAVTSDSISVAASCSSRSGEANRRCRSLTPPTARATLYLLGAWSGKIIVIFSNTASGRSRIVSRETSRLARTATVRPNSVLRTSGAPVSSSATARPAAVAARTGTPYATTRTASALACRGRQPTPSRTNSSRNLSPSSNPHRPPRCASAPFAVELDTTRAEVE